MELQELKKIKESKCAWPNCKEKQFMLINLQLMEQKESILSPETNMTIPTPFCYYHFALSRFCLSIKNKEKQGQYHLYGPFDIVEIIESTFTGLILAGKFRDIILAKEKADKEKQKMEENYFQNEEERKKNL